MFGNLFGNMEEKQAEMRRLLTGILLEAEAGNGAVTVNVNAARELLNININPDLLQSERQEELEDLLVVAINKALALAAEKEAEEAQKLVKNMLPPGLDKLFG